MSSRLATDYMGLKLRSPIVVSACPLSDKVANIVQMEDAGAGAVVLFSLFEEQIRKEQALLDHVRESTDSSSAEGSEFFPGLEACHPGPMEYLELIRRAKQRVDIPVIASLNGVTPDGWITYASQMQEAGADGIELNIFYIPADIRLTGVEVEQRYLRIVHAVTAAVDIPVAMKINPYLSAIGHVASQMSQLGASALVLFNRLYQPDIDTERLTMTCDLGLSEANEIRLPLLWLATLYGRTDASLAATTGVQGGKEVVKYLLAGADVVMTAGALYKHGIRHLTTMTRELDAWMDRKEFASIEGFRGILSHRNMTDPAGYDRAQYIRILETAGDRH